MILFLKPYFEIKPWAGEQLNKLYDCPKDTGEAWIVSGYKNKSSVVLNGKYKGQTLRHLWNKHPELFGGFKEKEFPLLLKLISSKEKLSVQVHPNDDYALKKNNSLGKFECWYILPETKNDSITLGIKAKNSLELKKIINDNLIENFLISKKIKQDDLIIVEPGTVHAINEDTFLLEVQEASDITYRLYDYNREPKRELHIEDSLNVIEYNNSVNRIHNFKEEDTFKNSHFTIYKLIINGKKKYENKGFEIFYVLNGNGILNNVKIKKGDSFILTSDSNKIEFNGELEILAVIPKLKERERLKMRKTALLTGVTTQDGYYLTKLLLNNNYEVHGIIESKSQLSNSNLGEFIDNDNFILHVGNLTDGSNLNRIIESVKPDEIYHLASQSKVDVSFDMPEYTTEVNCLGTLRLLDAIKSSEIRTKMFNLLSPYIFSGEISPQDETTIIDPKSPYAVSKAYTYYITKCYRENNNLFISNGICYNHESPKRDNSFVAKKIINTVKKIKQGKKEILYLGNLNSIREWGHASDYARAMWTILQQEKPDDFVISTGISCSVREFTTKVYEKIGIALEWCKSGLEEYAIDKTNNEVLVKVDSKLLRPNDASILVGNSKKFKNQTNFKFDYDLDSLIVEMLEE